MHILMLRFEVAYWPLFALEVLFDLPVKPSFPLNKLFTKMLV